MAALLELHGLTVDLPTPAGWIRPVDDVSFTLEAGESLGLVGESGSGKSMLALAIMGLLPPNAKVCGEVWFTGDGSRINLVALTERERIAIRGRDIAMIFQEPMSALNPVMRVGSQIAEAIRAHHRGLTGSAVQQNVVAALTRAAVPEPEIRARQYPHQLSGGLRQRVMIAMALAGGPSSQPKSAAGDGAGIRARESGTVRSSSAPRLLIADEPTTALDVTVQKQILELLAQLRRDLGLALLFITHDLGVVAQVADRIAVTYAGRIIEQGSSRDVLERPRHPYTAGLLRASPQLLRKKLEPIPGAVPALHELPPGCAFEPRCSLRLPECVAVMPELRPAHRDNLPSAERNNSRREEPRPSIEGHHARCVLVDAVKLQGPTP